MVAKLDDKPELKWIPIKDLYVDPAYQRGTQSKASAKNMEYIRHNFAWAYCGALIVCFVKETGKYAIIDGQHRCAAARVIGATEMPCMVIQGFNLQEQAKSFVIVNEKRVKLHHLAAFHAAAGAGEPEAMRLKQLADQCGVQILKYPVPNGEVTGKQCQCVSNLMQLLAVYNEGIIKWVLTIVPQAHPKKGELRPMLIKALCQFKKQYPGADDARMIAALGKFTPAKVESDARITGKMTGKKAVDIMLEQIEKHYKPVDSDRKIVGDGAIKPAQKSVDAPAKVYRYAGKVIKLTKEDYAKWEKDFPEVNLMSQLPIQDEWCHQHTLVNWFIPVRKRLEEYNRIMKEKRNAKS